jgi:hypothetical protein
MEGSMAINNPAHSTHPPRHHTKREDLLRKTNVENNQSRRKSRNRPHFNSLMSTLSFLINAPSPMTLHNNSNILKGEMDMVGTDNNFLTSRSHPGNR